MKLIEESYGTETLNLVLARSCLLCLLNNNRVMRYVIEHHRDLLVVLQKVVEDSKPEAVAGEG